MPTIDNVYRKFGEAAEAIHSGNCSRILTLDSLDALDALWSKALQERNRLFHSFYRKHNFRRNSPPSARGRSAASLQPKCRLLLVLI